MGCGPSKNVDGGGGDDKVDNTDVAQHGKNAAQLVRTAAGSLAAILQMVKLAYVDPHSNDLEAKQGLSNAIAILNTIAAGSAGLGAVFEVTGEFTLFADVRDINSDGKINAIDYIYSASEDAMLIAQALSTQIQLILQEIIKQNLGTPEVQANVKDALKQMATVDAIIAIVRNIYNTVKATGIAVRTPGLLTAAAAHGVGAPTTTTGAKNEETVSTAKLSLTAT